ncbi:DUF4190 domain-containing protein [Paludisphaera rhizosphaerae]|uniref:DUF4190 domain-containing protein n=1 Tax=Paludisphaera rhizosphaerae TaxID=2711216 RepID=UPI0013ECD657|nr:DUF4190 domain-containing protein [Paludisphaera rhizosphaerae]
MAIEHESTRPDESDLKMLRRSAIENEIPTYRAVSSLAVVAVLFGLLGALSFTHWAFYLCAAVAVVLGFLADRSIQKRSDVLTGQGLARAAMAMGLIFGLSIFTISAVQHFLAKRQAAAFAVEYGERLKSGSLAELYWIGLLPQQRANVTPEDNLKQMQSQASEAPMMDMKYGALRKLSQDLHGSPESTIKFNSIEKLEREDLTLVALALFDVHVGEIKDEHKEGEAAKEGEAEHKHEHQEPHDDYALAVIKGMVPENKNAYEWWIEDVLYPYKPKTAALPEKKVDDGHGHAGGH